MPMDTDFGGEGKKSGFGGTLALPGGREARRKLLLRPRQETGRLKDLRRLGLDSINHSNHNDAGGVNVQGQLDLLVLRLRLDP